ncbi:MAG: PepSY domain-containing protein, partial [Myxococcota bacterium]
DLLPQLRQFRIRRTVLVAWTDLHKVTGVLSLPFTYMMAYTGALIIFATALMGVVAAPVFGANPERIREVVTGPALPTARPIAATDVRLPVSAWMERAEAAIPGLEITLLEQRPDTSRVRVGGEVEGVRGFLEAHLDGVTGAVEKADRPHDLRPAQSTTNFMFALHFGTVGGWATKVVYAWLALIAAVTMISGNAMWLLRRRKRGLFGRGTAFLEGCTFGTGAGLPLATAATFYATQVYPFDWSDRVPGLELTFIVALAVSNLGAVVSRDRWRTASRQLILTGVLFLSLPFLRPGGLIGGGPAYLLAVELGWLVLAVVCFFVGLRLAGRTDLVRPSSVEAVEAPSHV